MTFSDEDLKLLRNELDHTDHYPKLMALLSRLEAAEKVAKAGISFHRDNRLCIPEKCEFVRDAEAWRKSKGE